MICLTSFALIPSMSRCSSALIFAISLVMADTRAALVPGRSCLPFFKEMHTSSVRRS